MDKTLKRILRVNHAGEYGAVRIYKGQYLVRPLSVFKEMQKQEEEHLATFSYLLITHKISPSLFQPFWYLGGTALGILSAALGEKTAHACTIAVEEVIDEHYEKQTQILEEGTLKDIIKKFQEDERHHHQEAVMRGGKDIPFYGVLSGIVKGITRGAIWISERF